MTTPTDDGLPDVPTTARDGVAATLAATTTRIQELRTAIGTRETRLAADRAALANAQANRDRLRDALEHIDRVNGVTPPTTPTV